MELMKYLPLIFTLLLFSTTICCQSVVNIPAGESVEFDYPVYEYAMVHLKNKGMKEIDVLVLNKETTKQLRGFGLGKLAKEKVMVESSAKLVLKNKNKTAIVIKIDAMERSKPIDVPTIKRVNFTLQNSSDKSIPLIIPTVMNPNLSPNSMSGVTLKMGQEVLFKVRGRKYVLLTVDESIHKDDILDVAKLLPKRKRELGLVK
jgi:hypothetical protein